MEIYPHLDQELSLPPGAVELVVLVRSAVGHQGLVPVGQDRLRMGSPGTGAHLVFASTAYVGPMSNRPHVVHTRPHFCLSLFCQLCCSWSLFPALAAISCLVVE